jgi:hypothetical protein
MNHVEEPLTVTPQDVRDLLFAARFADTAIVERDGLAVVVPELLIRGSRVIVRSGEVRQLVAEITKHVDRMFVGGHVMTFDGYVMAALAINRRCSEVVDGHPVKIVE